MKKSKNILMVGSDPTVKGGMTSVINMYKQAGLFNGNVEYLPSHISGNALKKTFFYINFLGIFLYKMLFGKNINVIHVHSSYKGSYFRKAMIIWFAFLFGKKTIFHLHGSEFNIFYNNMPKLVKKVISKTLNITTQILVLSKQWEVDIKSKCTNKKIDVLYNPTIINKKNSAKLQKKTNVLFMGLISKRKGAYDILESAKYLQNHNIEINMYGNGETKELSQKVKDNNLQNIIKVHGWISGNKINEAYSNAHIYVLPSYSEGLPMSILEAMSYGLPIISTNTGGIPDSVDNGVNGFLISPGDFKELAAKILLLANNFDLMKKMGHESYKIAKNKFSVDKIIFSLQEIYSKISAYQ